MGTFGDVPIIMNIAFFGNPEIVTQIGFARNCQVVGGDIAFINHGLIIGVTTNSHAVIHLNGVQLSQVLSQLNTQAALTIFNDSNVAFAQIAAGATLNSQCLAELTMDILTIITLEVHAEVLQALHGICDILVGFVAIMLKLIIWIGKSAVRVDFCITTKLLSSVTRQVL